MNTTATACPVVEPTFDDAMAAVEASNDQWDKNLVDNCILATIEEYGEASANEVRDRITNIRHRSLIGQRFNSLRMRGQILKVDRVISTDPGTHCKEIWTYRLARP